jgi:hypothetical protein
MIAITHDNTATCIKYMLIGSTEFYTGNCCHNFTKHLLLAKQKHGSWFDEIAAVVPLFLIRIVNCSSM